jgi:tetratricopeptide (TPR) repeat protein
VEIKMRIALPFLALGAAAMLAGGAAIAQRPDNQILPRSVELQKQGESLLAAGRYLEADDSLETALAVDPRNRSAFVDLARVADHQRLYGKAIRLASKALDLEPNDVNALEIQGQAMAELGAIPRAKENLAKLQKLCVSGCPQAAELSAAITRGPVVAEAKPAETPKSD